MNIYEKINNSYSGTTDANCLGLIIINKKK